MNNNKYLIFGFILLSISCLPTVKGQGRFVESLVKLRSSLDPQKFQKLLLKFTAKFFSPHDSTQKGEKWSTVFLAQSNSSRETLFNSKFNDSTPIKYSHFDFSNANEDGSYIAKVYREDIAMLNDMKKMFEEDDFDAKPRSDLPKDPMNVSKQHLELMLTKVLTVPRNHQYDKDSKNPIKQDVGGYIWAKIGSFGFLTGAQTFKPQQMLNPNEGNVPKGHNMIGILPGEMWGTPQDRILVVGGHWDTVKNTGGLDDNGSGVAAMLELARALYHGKCNTKYSVILVAFDLEEFGSQGSLVFVQDFLIPRVLEAGGYPQFTGAIIMDSLLHHNTSMDSQDMEKEWDDQVPDAAKSIQENRMRGDFLAAFTRATPRDKFLTETFRQNWDENKPSKEIRMENFLITKLNKEFVNLTVMSEHLNFLRSDHSRFWVANNKKYFASLPAILLTDTGPYRGNMRTCYHSPCDTYHPDKTDRINWNFYLHTVQSLIDTVAELSGAECNSRRKFKTPKEDPGKIFLIKEGSQGEAGQEFNQPKQNDQVDNPQNIFNESSVDTAKLGTDATKDVSKSGEITKNNIDENTQGENRSLYVEKPSIVISPARQEETMNKQVQLSFYSVPTAFYPLPHHPHPPHHPHTPHHHHHLVHSPPPPYMLINKMARKTYIPHWATLPW